MKKNVCSLFEQGVYYNVYEKDGFYVKENVETKEVSQISFYDYNFYRLVAYLNDSILAQKGIVNEYYSDEPTLNVQTSEEDDSLVSIEQEKTPDFADLEEKESLDLINDIQKGLNGDTPDIDDDERTLRELEKLVGINTEYQSSKGDVISESFINDDKRDEFELYGLDGEENTPDSLLDIDEDEFYFGDYVNEKKRRHKPGFIRRIIASRKPKEKREKLPKTKTSKKIKPKKEKKVKQTVVKETKVKPKKEKKVKEKREKVNYKMREQTKLRVKSSRPSKAKKRPATILAIVSAALLSVAVLGTTAYNMHNSNPDEKITFEFNQDELRMDTIKETFNKVIIDNKTMCESFKEDLRFYINTLYSYELSDETYLLILNNLATSDFTDKLALEVEDLKTIFNGNQNASIIAYELYNYKHNISYLNISKYQMIADVLSFSKDATVSLLDGHNVNEILKAVYGIDEVINVENHSIASGECNAIKALIEELKSKSFGKLTTSCELENNIFSPYIKIYDNVMECYSYFDKETGKGITEEVYRQQLLLLLSTHDTELDYSDVRDRELLYFYANALLDSNNAVSNDLTDLILNGVKSNYHVLDKFDFMKYMSGGEIDHVKACYLYGLMVYGENAIPLLQEINMCLKLDLEDGLISEETYNAFLEHLYYSIDAYAPHMKEAFKEAAEENKHMEGFSLKLFGDSQI